VIETAIIDREWEGWEGEIKGMLLQRIRRERPDFPSEGISWGRVGKGSPAHTLAWLTSHGKRAPDRIISVEELVRAG